MSLVALFLCYGLAEVPCQIQRQFTSVEACQAAASLWNDGHVKNVMEYGGPSYSSLKTRMVCMTRSAPAWVSQ